MKIEMGESLFYSWLRHVKDCKIVQNNWKVSPQWALEHEDDLEKLMKAGDELFLSKYNYNIFKKNASMLQILQQGECDVIGISLQDSATEFYTVDVAFHESGLNYGSKEETVMKVVAKLLRTAMILWGYLGTKNAELIFASPKINPAILTGLEPCMEDLNELFEQQGYGFRVKLIANSNFNDMVLQPILQVVDNVADTSELFLRSYQMLNLFSHDQVRKPRQASAADVDRKKNDTVETSGSDQFSEFKIGKLARVVLRRLLEEGKATEEEVSYLQQADYSKKTFDLQFPLLVREDGEYDSVRYYSEPLTIRGEKYKLCSQWFETSANNDRPYLVRWIENHLD